MRSRTIAVAAALVAASSAASAETFLRCEGTHRILGSTPVDRYAETSLRVDLDNGAIGYGDHRLEIYQLGDTKISAFTTYQQRGVQNLMMMSLDRVSGQLSMSEHIARELAPGEYGYNFGHDDDDTLYSMISTTTGECTVAERRF